MAFFQINLFLDFTHSKDIALDCLICPNFVQVVPALMAALVGIEERVALKTTDKRVAVRTRFTS